MEKWNSACYCISYNGNSSYAIVQLFWEAIFKIENPIYVYSLKRLNLWNNHTNLSVCFICRLFISSITDYEYKKSDYHVIAVLELQILISLLPSFKYLPCEQSTDQSDMKVALGGLFIERDDRKCLNFTKEAEKR